MDLRKFLITAFCTLFVTCEFSPSPRAAEARTLSYEEAVAIALNQSYSVKSFRENLAAMEYQYDYHRSMFKPRIDLGMFAPSLNESVSPIQQTEGLPVYNSTGIMQIGGDLTFKYMLPTGGNLALSTQLYRENLKTVLALQDFRELRSDQAYSSLSLSFTQPIFTANTLRENLNEARFRFEKTSSQFTRRQMDIVYDVTENFYSLYRSVRAVEIAREKLDNSEEAYQVATLKFGSGRIPQGDVLIAEIERSRNQAALLAAEGTLERVKDEFRQHIGLDADEDFRISTDLTYEPFDIDSDTAITAALENRPELYEARLDIELQRISVERAERQREFSGEISAYYDLTGVSTLNTGTTRDLFESSFDNFIDRPPNRGIMLTFSYPVFDWGRGKAKVSQERASLRERELDNENTNRTIVREVKDIVRRVEEARSRLEIHEKNQQVAQRSYEISRMRFENGDITSQELSREQERLADSQLEYLDAFIAYQLAVNDLKRKTMWDFRNNRSYLVDKMNIGE